jgi:hypothetical protein
MNAMIVANPTPVPEKADSLFCGLHVMVTRWNVSDRELRHINEGSDRWKSALAMTVYPHVPSLRMAGVIDAWVSHIIDGDRYIVSVHSSESSMDEARDIWQTVINELGGSHVSTSALDVRCGRAVDINSAVWNPAAKRAATDWELPSNERWIEISRWRSFWRASEFPGRKRAAHASMAHVNSRVRPDYQAIRKWAIDMGDDDLTIVRVFEFTRNPRQSKESLNQSHVISKNDEPLIVPTESIAGRGVDLFALASEMLIPLAPNPYPELSIA